jgi:hypothetical protein
VRPADVVKAAREIMGGARAAEFERLDPIRVALEPRSRHGQPSVELPKNALPVMKNLALKSRTNLLPLVLDTFSQVMKVDGFTPTEDDGGKSWSYWQRNRFDALQTGVHRSALAFGSSYVTVLPGTNGPAWQPRSPLTMTALYADPTVDEWPILALDVDGSMLRLYDEDNVYYIGHENAPRPFVGYASTPWGAATPPVADLAFIEARPHPMGVCPVVRYRDRMLLDGEEQFGIVEPLMSIQQRIDETVFGMLIAQFYSAFKQRYVIGWVPADEREKLQASASTMWTFEDATVKVGELTETDLTRYISAKDSAKADMAAIAQVPAQALGQQGISNVSGAVMDGLETGKDFKAAEITTSFGESHEQLFRASAHIDGHEAVAADFAAEVRWRNTVQVSLAQATDALGKWVAQLGVNDKLARNMLPGWTDQMERENARLGPSVQPDAAHGGADPLGAFLAQMERQAGPVGQ